MLLDEQRETPFDLRFRLFGTAVRICPWFWVVAIIVYWDYIKIGPQYLLVAVLCVFFSILLHEFGHVFMGRLFGSHGYIVLQGMCGLAVGSANQSNRWQRIAVMLAGPGIQLLFFALLATILYLAGNVPFILLQDRISDGSFLDRIPVQVAILSMQPGWPDLLRTAIRLLLFFNLFWAIINLLPVWPLDGGQVTRELLRWATPTNGTRYSLAISLVTASVVTINSISAAMNGPTLLPGVLTGGVFFILFFAIFAVESFILMQQELARYHGSFRDPDDADRLPWESDPDDWKRGR